MFTIFYFQKQPLLFHLFNLSIHLLNVILIYYILRVSLGSAISKNSLKRFLPATLTLIWAVHPVIVESVLLSTNFGATLSYSFFFAFILDFLINKRKNNSLIREFIIPVIFLIPMLTTEYIVVLPFVLFIISFYDTYKNNSFKKAFKLSFRETKPYLTGLLLYIIIYSVVLTGKITQPVIGNQFIIFAERVLWFAPQLFVHFLKLVFYPHILSTDQTLFVHLGKTLFAPYSIFCILIFIFWLFLPLYLFIKKRKADNLFLLNWTFFFALLPFLHIIVPSYLLAAERYLYCPLALLMFSLLKVLSRASNKKILIAIAAFLILISSLCLTRSYYRMLDWKDNYSFIISTYKSTDNPFLKAIKLNMLEDTLNTIRIQNKKSVSYYEDIFKLLQEAKYQNMELKAKYQNHLPLVIKSYGLDYEATLAKIASLEAIIRCLQLKENYNIGLELLNPYINRPELLDPRIFQVYANWLISNNKISEAKQILLNANHVYPNISSILMGLFDITIKYEDTSKDAEKYIIEALKYYLSDTSILSRAVSYYEGQKNSFLTARYSYLFAVLTQSKIAYQKALSAYMEAGYLRNAREIVPKLLKIAPNDPGVLYTISDYYYKTNDYKNALIYLTNAYSISLQRQANPKLIFDTGYTLTQLHLSLGNKELAGNIGKEIFIFAENDNNSLIKLAKLYKSLDLKDNLNICLQKIKQQSN